VVQPVLDAWAAESPRHFPNYASGSDGPQAAEALLRHDHRAWRPLVDANGGAPSQGHDKA
jgi:glucose-6-phosphate 1-dehydrogenase